MAAIEDRQRKFYGVQFHPEVDLTEHGNEILHNFLYRVAEFSGAYTMEDREEEAIKYIQDTVGDEKGCMVFAPARTRTVLGWSL